MLKLPLGTVYNELMRKVSNQADLIAWSVDEYGIRYNIKPSLMITRHKLIFDNGSDNYLTKPLNCISYITPHFHIRCDRPCEEDVSKHQYCIEKIEKTSYVKTIDPPVNIQVYECLKILHEFSESLTTLKLCTR